MQKYDGMLKVGTKVRFKHKSEQAYQEAVIGKIQGDDIYLFIWWDNARKTVICSLDAVADSNFVLHESTGEIQIEYRTSYSGRIKIPKDARSLLVMDDYIIDNIENLFNEYEKILGEYE